jgi:hypothetical protein
MTHANVVLVSCDHRGRDVVHGVCGDAFVNFAAPIAVNLKQQPRHMTRYLFHLERWEGADLHPGAHPRLPGAKCRSPGRDDDERDLGLSIGMHARSQAAQDAQQGPNLAVRARSGPRCTEQAAFSAF